MLTAVRHRSTASSSAFTRDEEHEPAPRPPASRATLAEHDLLCFGHDFQGDPLSKTHLMRLMAARGSRVLWINSIGYRAPSASGRDLRRLLTKLQAVTRPVREVEPNLFVLDVLALPAHGSAWGRAVNRALLELQVGRAIERLGLRRVISFIYNPTAGVVARRLGEELVVYHCVDEFTAMAGVPPQLAESEDRLLDKADLVIVSSERLLRAKAPRCARSILVRHGVAFDHFRKALAPSTRVPSELEGLPRPILGYFGLLGGDWVDVGLLDRVAEHFASGSLVLLGEVSTDLGPLRARPNVHLLGRRPFASLPAYCKGFDVALNPFPINEVTLASNPLKVREYLAAGLPVVSTRIPEVARLDEVRIADDRESFLGAIEDALWEPGPKAERGLSMRAQSWEARLDEITEAIVALPARRRP